MIATTIAIALLAAQPPTGGARSPSGGWFAAALSRPQPRPPTCHSGPALEVPVAAGTRIHVRRLARRNGNKTLDLLSVDRRQPITLDCARVSRRRNSVAFAWKHRGERCRERYRLIFEVAGDPDSGGPKRCAVPIRPVREDTRH